MSPALSEDRISDLRKGGVRDYSGWSFGNRSFVLAVGMSLLWHFFWFFSITITVTSGRKPLEKPRPKIVSLGPVLDDSILRALLENKPQLSETFYRRAADFSPFVDVEVKTIERHTAGEVVSLPFGKRLVSSVRHLLGGDKAAPDYEFSSRIQIKYPTETPRIEGIAKDRHLLSRPEMPTLPPGTEASFYDNETELAFVVEPSGSVSEIEVTLSSGNPDLDVLWVRYMRGWQFAPLSLGEPRIGQNGKVRFRFVSPGGEGE